MGSQVLVIFKIFPENPEDVGNIESALKGITVGKLMDLKRQPIGFGVELIRVGFAIPDKTEGLMDKLSEAIKAIPGVNEIEEEGATLI